MFNSINPINIVYRKPQDTQSAQKNAQKSNQNIDGTNVDGQKRGEWQENQNAKQQENIQKRPNNTVNIAQILTDFKRTISAINAPKEINDEVNVYLNLVEKESYKENPSKDIVLSNLRNASRISDGYITETLKKPSRVVEGWIDALFMQNVDIKSDPTYINDIFKIKFPNDKPQKTQEVQTEKETPQIETAIPEETQKAQYQTLNKIEDSAKYYKEAERELKAAFLTAKKISEEDPAKALKIYENALLMTDKENNKNFKNAIHFERGKIFDKYDYVPTALGEYNEATTTVDNNLKSQAHLKMAKIYDSYVKDAPAVEHYTKAITFAAEANNTKGQTVAVKHLTEFFARRYDAGNTQTFNDLTLDCAKECKDSNVLGDAYASVAKNYEYVGEDERAMKAYKMAARTYSDNENYKEIAKNYYDASKLMRKIGNDTKANALLSKAKQYEMM